MVLLSLEGMNIIASAFTAHPITLTTPSGPVGIAVAIPPGVSLAYKVTPGVQFHESNLTIEPNRATLTAFPLAFTSIAIPNNPPDVAIASASTFCQVDELSK